MPKISKHCGPSHKGEPRPQPPVPKPAVKVRVDVTSDERLADLLRQVVSADEPHPDELRAAQTEQAILNAVIPEEVESSPGSSSSASTPKQPTSTEPSRFARRKPARSMGSRSVPDLTGSSSASSTAGGPTAPTSATEPDQAEQAP